MAKEQSTPSTIQLIAIERGFAAGRMVEPGTKFLFNTHTAEGKLRKLPKWAQEASKSLPKKKAPAGDLKPTAAQQAVADKRAGLAGGLPAGSADQVNGSADVKVAASKDSAASMA